MEQMINGINNYLKEAINQEYDKIKTNLLKDLELKIELQRNRLVNDILNAVDIRACESPLGVELNITINKVIRIDKE